MEANEASAPRELAHDVLATEAAELGLPPNGLTVDSLTHNPLNMVTDDLHRISWMDDGVEQSAVRKVVTRSGQGEAHWQASDDPRHWNYWRREALVYQTDLPGRLGLTAPALLGSFDRGEDSVVLWLEGVSGVSGADSTVQSLADAGRALGLAQGRNDLPSDAFLSRNFIADYAASKPVPISLLDEDAEVWQHPLIRECWPQSIRADFAAMFEHRAALHAVLASMPRTVCHLDAWPNNIIAAPEPTFVDWAFCGDGAVGEDIGNLIPDAVLDLLIPASELDDLESSVLQAYVDGLATAGSNVSRATVQHAMMASAVKYYWLVPLLLSRVDAEQHMAYGVPTDPVELYGERGVALSKLGEWSRTVLATL